MAKTKESNLAAPHVSFKTFKAFIESLKETTVPGKLDRSVLPKMSGVFQTQLLGAMKFLQLTDANGTTLPLLKELVEAFGTPGWSNEMEHVVFNAYDSITDGLNVENGTASQLKAAFASKGNVDGQLLVKAIRFWLNAMEESKAKVSSFFKAPSMPKSANGQSARKSDSSGKPQSNKKPQDRSGDDDDDDDDDDDRLPPPPKSGMIAYPIGFMRYIHVPIDLTDADCEAIESLLPGMRSLAKSHQKKGGTR